MRRGLFGRIVPGLAMLVVSLAPVRAHSAAAQGVTVALVPITDRVVPGAMFDLDLVVTKPGASFNGFGAVVGYDPAALDEAVQAHYLLQVKIYSVTACRFLGIRDVEHYERAFGGVVYVFLRGLPEGGVWTCRPSWDELRAWERDLENLRPERWTLAHAGGAHHV